MNQDFKFFFKKLGIFVLVDTFELLSHYPNIIHNIQIVSYSHWLRKDVQWITDKVFRVFMASHTFFSHFSTEFSF